MMDQKSKKLFWKKEESDKKDLEATIKDKVVPLLEETLEKSFGITIPKIESDITDQLAKPSLSIYVPLTASFKDAKKKFKEDFLRRELMLKRGNVSQLAKILGIDRRSVHRAIKEFEIDVDIVRGDVKGELEYKEKVVEDTIRGTLEQYKRIFHPQKMEDLYREVPALSKNIAKVLAFEQLGWKEAEREFEKQFIVHHLEEKRGDLKKVAMKMGLRGETLQRKMKKFGLR